MFRRKCIGCGHWFTANIRADTHCGNCIGSFRHEIIRACKAKPLSKETLDFYIP